jgi:ERF superfamily
MQRSSPSIASLAAALAKAQQELENPQKSLIGSVRSEGTDAAERLFRYASLSSGLDIVRKTLGQHEIATVQTTTIDQPAGIVSLTTMLAHASGEWIASDWPVCAVADTAEPHRMGAALTYARRYALFTLVGIAGEDDLDAPDLITPAQDATGPSGNRGGKGTDRHGPVGNGNGSASAGLARPRWSKQSLVTKPVLEPRQSQRQRDQLLTELKGLSSSDAVTAWAQRILPVKNNLAATDAQSIEGAFRTKLATLEDNRTASLDATAVPDKVDAIDKSALTFPEPRRIRDKEHLRFVAKQPCLRCARCPADPHHLRFAQNRALGRKVSDEFTVPLCRGHHREVHRCGDEAAWWSKAGIDPLAHARALWLTTHPLPKSPNTADAEIGAPPAATSTRRKGKSARPADKRRANYKTKPIEKTAAHDIV